MTGGVGATIIEIEQKKVIISTSLQYVSKVKNQTHWSGSVSGPW